MNAPSVLKEKKQNPDFSLLISKLENAIIVGRNDSACRKALSRADVWMRLDMKQQLKWTRLCRIAGVVDTALKVLEHINKENREFAEAWIERIDLLALLDRREDLSQCLASCRDIIGAQKYQELLNQNVLPTGAAQDDDLDSSISPFEVLRRRQNSIMRYLELFSGREDCFARQWVDKKEGKQGYVPVRRPIETHDIEEHLSGQKTFGIYLLKSDATVQTAVIDVDLVKQYRSLNLKADEKRHIKRERNYLVQRITELSKDAGMNPCLEFSGGKGYHFWYFFKPCIEAAEAKDYLGRIKKSIAGDLSAFSLEVFPKQGRLSGKGFGNLVKLPLGVHRLSGKKSYFVECSDRAIASQLDYLFKVEFSNLDKITVLSHGEDDDKVVIHPRLQEWANEFPELNKLEQMCLPLAQIFAMCRRGKEITQKEEKILYQTLGFLSRKKTILHHLMAYLSDYNPHLVDFKLSRLRGTPLGCKRIHSLLNINEDICRFDTEAEYANPLLHLEENKHGIQMKAEKVETLTSALDNLNLAMSQVRRFLK